MRFSAPDWSPFGEGGINPYAYCAGDPINSSDLFGHMSWWLGIGVAVGGLGLAVFSGGSSLAIAGAAFGAVSATSAAIAANSSGSTHDMLEDISFISGIAGSVVDFFAVTPRLLSAASRWGGEAFEEEEKILTLVRPVYRRRQTPRLRGDPLRAPLAAASSSRPEA